MGWQLKQNNTMKKTFKFTAYEVFDMLDDVITKMSFKDLCDAAFGLRAISVVEFKF